MSRDVLAALMAGGVAVGYLIVSVFFLRFWSRTRDSLFATFALAFALMAVSQVLPIVFGIPQESQSGIYLLRLAAFLLIIVAIVRKNLSGR